MQDTSDALVRATTGLLTGIAERVRVERARRQFTQEELAHRAGVSRVHLGGIERGEVSCSITVLAQIAAALELPIYALLPSNHHKE